MVKIRFKTKSQPKRKIQVNTYTFKILTHIDRLWLTLFSGHIFVFSRFGLFYLPDSEDLTYKVLFNLGHGFYKYWTIEEMVLSEDGFNVLVDLLDSNWYLDPDVRKYIQKRLKDKESGNLKVGALEVLEDEDELDEISEKEKEELLTYLFNSDI